MTETVREKVSTEQAERVARWQDMWNRGDAAGLARLYAENASFCSARTGIVTGRAAIEAVFQNLMNMGLKTARAEALEGEERGDQGYVVTHFEFLNPEGQVVSSGHALTIAIRERGEWQATHHWTVNDPPPAA